MKHSLRTRLERIERQRAAPHPTDDLKPGMGLSALLESMPPHEPDASVEATLEEAAYMRLHRTEIAALCQPSKARGLGALLDDYRQELATARRLMAEELNHV